MLDLSREETAPQIKGVQEENNDLNLEDLKIMNNFLCKYFPSFRENFVPGESRRLTMLMWLDGNDTQAKGDAPRDGSIKLGLNINATEYIAQ